MSYGRRVEWLSRQAIRRMSPRWVGHQERKHRFWTWVLRIEAVILLVIAMGIYLHGYLLFRHWQDAAMATAEPAIRVVSEGEAWCRLHPESKICKLQKKRR